MENKPNKSKYNLKFVYQKYEDMPDIMQKQVKKMIAFCIVFAIMSVLGSVFVGIGTSGYLVGALSLVGGVALYFYYIYQYYHDKYIIVEADCTNVVLLKGLFAKDDKGAEYSFLIKKCEDKKSYEGESFDVTIKRLKFTENARYRLLFFKGSDFENTFSSVNLQESQRILTEETEKENAE